MRKRLSPPILLVLIFGLSAICSAADIYITQNTSGSDTGADCTNAHSVSWFGSNQAAGNTYHLCGTFTGAAKSTGILNVSAGSAGAPKTILFEPGAGMTAPVWGSGSGTYPTSGAINIHGSYVTVDGGTNGSITATLSGASGTTCPGGTCQYDQSSSGLYIASGLTNVEVKNVSITNIYLCNDASSCNSGSFTAGIMVGPSSTETNLSIDNNTIDGVAVEIYLEYSGGALSNVNVYNNTLGSSAHGGFWGINIGSGSAGNTTSNVNVYGNTITGCSDWSGEYNGGAGAHCDGVIVFSTSVSNTFNIYNNKIDFTGPLTGDVFCTYGGSSPGASCNIFNNVLLVENSTCSGVGGGRDVWLHDGAGSQYLYNNTLVGSSASCFLVEAEGTVLISRFENNILTQENWGVERLTTGNVTLSDYNLYNTPNAVWKWGSTYESFSAWQGSGFDTHGVSGNPNLDANYKLQASSTNAIGKGTNLYSLCNGQPTPGLGALCYDKAGVARPSTGAWDVGAYQYNASSATAPPTNLTAVVN